MGPCAGLHRSVDRPEPCFFSKERIMRKILAGLAIIGLIGGAGALQFTATPPAVASSAVPQATGSISGKVVDSSGNPVAGAIVRIMRIPGRGGPGGHRGGPRGRWQKPTPGKTNWHVMVFGVTATADDGTFTANNAPVGRYRIFVMDRGVGFGHVRRPVTVTDGGNANAGTITLQQRRHGGPRGPHRPGH